MSQQIKLRCDSGDILVEPVVYDSRMIDFVVREDHTVELRVPEGMDQRLVDSYIRNNERAIIEKYEKALRANWDITPDWDIVNGKTQYASGVILPFLGKEELVLKIKKTLLKKGTRIYPKNGEDGRQYLMIETDNTDQDFIRYCIMNYYKKCALGLVELRLERLAELMGLEYSEVKISNCGPHPKFHYARLAYRNLEVENQPTIWGNCNRFRQLKFDWKLAMLPMEIVEYIFIHELGHLKKMNHSAAFWAEVKKMMPNYQMCKEWLEIHGQEYEIY